jgi:hypothetical protein
MRLHQSYMFAVLTIVNDERLLRWWRQFSGAVMRTGDRWCPRYENCLYAWLPIGVVVMASTLRR